MAQAKQEVLKLYIEDKELRRKYNDHIDEHNTKINNDEYSDSGFDLLCPNNLKINNKTLANVLDFKIKTALVCREREQVHVNYENAIFYGSSLLGLFILLNQVLLGFYVSLLVVGALMINENPNYIENYDSSSSSYIETPLPYMLLPRSSTGKKTPLRLSNSVGIIDKGYRGNLMACVDNMNHNIDYEEVSLLSSLKTSDPQNDVFEVQEDQRLFQVVSFTGNEVYVELVNSLDELSITDRGEGGFGSTDTKYHTDSEDHSDSEDSTE